MAIKYNAYFTTQDRGESLEAAAQRAAQHFARRNPSSPATHVFVSDTLGTNESPIPGLELGRAKVGKSIVGVGVLE